MQTISDAAADNILKPLPRTRAIVASRIKDPYKTLGVPRTATADEIKKAFRSRAKQFHPDHNAGSKRDEEKFKELNEAYAILSDEDKRRQFDQLGRGFESFQGAPGWESVFGGARGAAGGAGRGPAVDLGDFFNMLRGSAGAAGGRAADPSHPAESESEILITLEEAFQGCTKKIVLAVQEGGMLGRSKTTQKSLDVRIPPGIRTGQKIRLKGQGVSRDLLISVRIQDHPVYSLEGGDLTMDLAVSPWEAALGEKIPVSTLGGNVEVKLPPGVGSGQKLRLRGHGFPGKPGEARGDLICRVMIAVPKTLSSAERGLFERLKETSRFNARDKI